jgi:Thrombospondin type 1 domain
MQACNTEICSAYAFTVGGWSICSTACGGGTQVRAVACVNQGSGAVVPDSLCMSKSADKPAAVRQCNISPCRGQSATWVVNSISPCDRPVCGGVQRREISCRCADAPVVCSAASFWNRLFTNSCARALCLAPAAVPVKQHAHNCVHAWSINFLDPSSGLPHNHFLADLRTALLFRTPCRRPSVQ